MANEVYVVIRQNPTTLFLNSIRDNPSFLADLQAKTKPVLEKAGGESVLSLGMHAGGGLAIYRFPDLEAWRTYNTAWNEVMGFNSREYWTRSVEFGFSR